MTSARAALALQEPLSFCLSHEIVAVTVGEDFVPLERGVAESHTLALQSAVDMSLHGFGAAPVYLKERPRPVGSLEGLGLPLDEAAHKGATLLLAFGLDVREFRLVSPFLSGDQYPLRTVKILVNAWIVDPETRDVLAEFNIPQTRAANSSSQAIADLTVNDLADPLAQALRAACARQHPESHPEQSDPNLKVLKIIRETANGICIAVPTSGSDSSLDLSGKAKEQLQGGMSKVLGLGIAGTAKYHSAEYAGVLQRELATAIKNSNDCKIAVLNTLMDRLLPRK